MIIRVDGSEDGDTQSSNSGSMPSTISSILQVSDFHKASSFSLLKGKAKMLQIHTMWSAFREATLPCGSNDTRIDFFEKCHTSLINLMTAGSMIKGLTTLYHGIMDFKCSNFWRFSSLKGTNLSTTGSHTTSYWLSDLVCESLYIWLRIIISSVGMSRSDISSSTCFLFSTSRFACLYQQSSIVLHLTGWNFSLRNETAWDLRNKPCCW